MDSKIDDKVFENCGQELYDTSVQTEYQNIEQKMLLSSLHTLQSELTILNNEISELTTCLTELNSHYNLHNTHITSNTFSFLFTSGYNATLYQIQTKFNDTKEELDKKNREKSILLHDIDTITSQLSTFNE